MAALASPERARGFGGSVEACSGVASTRVASYIPGGRIARARLQNADRAR
jgi:hypothetical protein